MFHVDPLCQMFGHTLADVSPGAPPAWHQDLPLVFTSFLKLFSRICSTSLMFNVESLVLNKLKLYPEDTLPETDHANTFLTGKCWV